MDLASFVIWTTLYFIGVVLAYGAMLDERLTTLDESVAPWEEWGLRFNALLSWFGLILIATSSLQDGRMFDYQFTIPPDRMWHGEDNGL